MNFKTLLAGGVAAGVLICAGSASAVVLASSPAMSGSTPSVWVNRASGQNFLVQFTLGQDSLIDGFGIYSRNTLLPLGAAVTVRIRGDVAGSPAASYLHDFSDVIDTVTPFSGSTVFGSAHFSPIALSAGTYWMGMSGSTADLGWASYDLGVTSPTTQRQYSGNTLQHTPSIRNLAYSVEGSVVTGPGAIPEPATWGLLIGGFALAGATLRRRRAQPA